MASTDVSRTIYVNGVALVEAIEHLAEHCERIGITPDDLSLGAPLCKSHGETLCGEALIVLEPTDYLLGVIDGLRASR